MRNNLLKFIIILSGIICLYGLLAIRFLPLYNFVASDKLKEEYWDYNKYGELYYYSNIRYFREDLPKTMKKFQFKDKHPKLQDAQILTFGDSYLDFSKHIQLSERLQDSLKIPVFYEYTTDPLYFLAEQQYINNESKIIVYVRNERWIPITFGENTYIEPPVSLKKDYEESKLISFLKNFRDFLFEDRTDELLRSLINRSYIISEINSAIATLKFDLFGYISAFTPEYSLEYQKPWLFFYDQVNEEKTSFYYQHSDDEIMRIADNIQLMSETFKEKYNLRLLMMIVPAKYTIHHKIVAPYDNYNNLIPRLQSELSNRSIEYVNLYDFYLKTDHDLYYGTDDHWTENGVQISTEKLIKRIKEVNPKVN